MEQAQISKTKIKAIIFDWGGVLIENPCRDIYRYCADALGVSTEDFVVCHRKIESDFTKGLISEHEYWRQVCRCLFVPEPDLGSLWYEAFQSVYRPRKEVFEFVEQLYRTYTVAILSNTEHPSMRFFLEQDYDLFDHLIFSCAEGCRKPQNRIYQKTLERIAVLPEEAVFIDDIVEYVDAARELGINAIVYEDFQQVCRHLQQIGVPAG